MRAPLRSIAAARKSPLGDETAEKDRAGILAGIDPVPANADIAMIVLRAERGSPGLGPQKEKKSREEIGRWTGLVRLNLADVEVIETGMIVAAEKSNSHCYALSTRLNGA